MKRIVFIVFVMIFGIVLTSCSSKSDPPVSFEASCWEQVNNCKTEKVDDGKIKVTLSAPDYVAIVDYFSDNNSGNDLTLEMIDSAIKNNPELVKEYSFNAVSNKEEDIKAALLEQIAYELLELAVNDFME